MRVLIKKIFIITSCVTLFDGAVSYSFNAVNFFRSDESYFRLPPMHDAKMQLSVNVEAGRRSTGLATDGTRKNILTLNDPVQKVVQMGTNPVFDIKQLLSNPRVNNLTVVANPGPVNVTIRDDIQRGFTVFNGDFSEFDVTLHGRLGAPFKSILGTVALDVYLPIKRKSISNVTFANLSPTPTPDPIFGPTNEEAMTLGVNTFISNLVANVAKIGGPNLSSLDKSGLGDLMVLLSWDQHFREDEDFARDINVFFRIGVSCPTADKKDEDQAFSMPLGYDGSWGLPIGIGFSMELVRYLKLGFDVDFLPLFDETHSRRVKTHPDQTEFLLLNKANVTKKPGFTWEIDPYIQIYRYAQGLSVKLGYQYVHHDLDKLTLKDKNFAAALAANPGPNIADANALINTANSLKAWDVHNLILQLNWDVAECVKDVPGAPQLSFFYKWPFDGKNIIDTPTLGGQIGFNF